MLVICTNDNWIVIVRWMLCAMFPGKGPGMLHTLPNTPVPTPTFFFEKQTRQDGCEGYAKAAIRKNLKLLCKHTLNTHWAPKQVCLCMYQVAGPSSHRHYRSWTYDIWNLVVSMWVLLQSQHLLSILEVFPHQVPALKNLSQNIRQTSK